MIKAPNAPAHWPAFREALVKWRREAKERSAYDDALYRRPDFAWARSSDACCFLMLSDEKFCDPAAGRFTAESFLAEGVKEFGGYDS